MLSLPSPFWLPPPVSLFLPPWLIHLTKGVVLSPRGLCERGALRGRTLGVPAQSLGWNRGSARSFCLASAGGAGASGKHKELRRWTHAGRWGDEASGFVWLLKEGWRGGSLCFNPSARVCVRNRGFLLLKYLKAKLNFGIVA